MKANAICGMCGAQADLEFCSRLCEARARDTRPEHRKATFEELLAQVRKLPPMSAEEKVEQAIDWAHGNLMCTTNHKVSRQSVEILAWRKAFRDTYAALVRLRANSLEILPDEEAAP